MCLISGTIKKYGLFLFSEALSQQKSFIYSALSRFSTSNLGKIKVHQNSKNGNLIDEQNRSKCSSHVLVLMHTFKICFKKVPEQMYIEKKIIKTKQVALKIPEYAICLLSAIRDGVGLDLISIVFNK